MWLNVSHWYWSLKHRHIKAGVCHFCCAGCIKQDLLNDCFQTCFRWRLSTVLVYFSLVPAALDRRQCFGEFLMLRLISVHFHPWCPLGKLIRVCFVLIPGNVPSLVSWCHSHITLQPKTGCPLKLSRVELVSTWMGDLLGKLGCCWKRC